MTADSRGPLPGVIYLSVVDRPRKEAMSAPQNASTPEPVVKAAAVWGSLATLLVTAVGVLVAVGVLSSEQADALSAVVDYVSSNIVTVGSVVVGLSTLVSGLAGSFATALVGRRHVTPVPPAVQPVVNPDVAS